MPIFNLSHADYLCLIYERKAKEVGRVVMKCNKVIDNVGDPTEQDRVVFNRSLRETLRLERQDLKDKAKSIWNTLVSPVLTLPAPSPERTAARLKYTPFNNILCGHAMISVTRIKEEYERGTCTPALGHFWSDGDYPNKNRAITPEATKGISELFGRIREMTEPHDVNSLTVSIPKGH